MFVEVGWGSVCAVMMPGAVGEAFKKSYPWGLWHFNVALRLAQLCGPAKNVVVIQYLNVEKALRHAFCFVERLTGKTNAGGTFFITNCAWFISHEKKTCCSVTLCISSLARIRLTQFPSDSFLKF